jgi:hypothetical protein
MKRLLCSVVLVAFAARAQMPPGPPPPPDDVPQAEAAAPPRPAGNPAMVQPPGSTWAARVHVSNSRSSPLELRRDGPRGQLICSAPCDQVVQFAPSDPFVVTGPGLVPSEPFHLKLVNGELNVRAEPTLEIARTAGKGLVLVGGGGFIVGLIASYAGFVGCIGTGGESCPSTNTIKAIEFMGLIGIGLALAGGAVLLLNPPTSVTVSE